MRSLGATVPANPSELEEITYGMASAEAEVPRKRRRENRRRDVSGFSEGAGREAMMEFLIERFCESESR